MPEKIQDNLASLEIAASPVRRMSGLHSPSPVEQQHPYNFSASNGPPAQRRDDALYRSEQSLPSQKDVQPSPYQKDDPFAKRSDASGLGSIDQPSFSPFPPLRNRPSNVPPSDDEKEGVLEKARLPVLNCNDPEVQLSWAQDVLNYVDIATQHEARISQNQAARPQTPAIEHQLRVDSVNVVSFLAEQHHPKAEFLKGMWLEFGKFGFRMDKKEAFRCYQRSAQRGYARAEYRIGMQFESSNDPEKAIQHYQLGVDSGDSASNYRMGMMYLLGQHSQPQDFAKGVKMISYAAETADENAPQGAYVYGMLLARELAQVSVPEQYLKLNYPGARYNLEKAAYLGFAKAQTKMGTAYELSQLGCEFNPVLSLHYNALSSKQGEPEADMSIGKWFLCGYEGIFEKNEELAFTYSRRAAESGLATAEFAMGYFYEVGIYVSVDLKASRSWYEKAADHGNKDAASRIDGIARSKTLSRKDHEQMAVAKIRSQYGSQKGKRPERFKEPDHMPTISDMPTDSGKLDMPEPKLPPSRAGHRTPAPYPSNLGQYGPAARPTSVAPYPLDDGAMGQQSNIRPYTDPRNQKQNPPRASSNVPPMSPTGEVSFGDKNYRGSAFPTFKPSPAQTGSPARGRTPQPPVPGAMGPQGYRQPPQNPEAPPKGPSSAPNGARPPPSQTPAIDIGFSAPPDPSGADRKKLQKSDNRPLAPGNPSRNSAHEASQGPPQKDRLSSLPHTSRPAPHNREPSPARRAMSAGGPDGAGPPPQGAHQHPVDGTNLEKPPKLQDPSAPGRVSNTPPPSQSAGKPPGKGPKTFGEMGLPPQQKENDCVSL